MAGSRCTHPGPTLTENLTPAPIAHALVRDPLCSSGQYPASCPFTSTVVDARAFLRVLLAHVVIDLLGSEPHPEWRIRWFAGSGRPCWPSKRPTTQRVQSASVLVIPSPSGCFAHSHPYVHGGLPHPTLAKLFMARYVAPRRSKAPMQLPQYVACVLRASPDGMFARDLQWCETVRCQGSLPVCAGWGQSGGTQTGTILTSVSLLSSLHAVAVLGRALDQSPYRPH